MNNPHIKRKSVMKRVLIPVLINILFAVSLYSQQFPSYTQFTMNKFLINPAVAGIDGFTTVNLFAREEWVGFKGTPRTHALSVDSRILGNSYILRNLAVRKNETEKTRSGRMSWGASIWSDLNGPIDKTVLNGTYGYHIDLGESQLSFGMSMLLYQLRIQDDQFIQSDDAVDPLIIEGDQSIWITDANFGIFYTARNYYAGYSTIQLFNSGAQFGEKGQGKYQLDRQHNIIGGYRFNNGGIFEVEPAVLLKIPESGVTQFDLNIKCTYNSRYWAGLNYRTNSIMSIFGGINYERYYFGYAFDYPFGNSIPNTYGSHEFTVSARFGDTARRYKWLRSY